MKDSTNDRIDEYGGSKDNRCHFTVKIIYALFPEVVTDLVGLRLPLLWITWTVHIWTTRNLVQHGATAQQA
jgi:2,4-dienoyl-CoA reductase-like NADH-dependent reductase (Old Yellow Enzyme family)